MKYRPTISNEGLFTDIMKKLADGIKSIGRTVVQKTSEAVLTGMNKISQGSVRINNTDMVDDLDEDIEGMLDFDTCKKFVHATIIFDNYVSQKLFNRLDAYQHLPLQQIKEEIHRDIASLDGLINFNDESFRFVTNINEKTSTMSMNKAGFTSHDRVAQINSIFKERLGGKGSEWFHKALGGMTHGYGVIADKCLNVASDLKIKDDMEKVRKEAIANSVILSSAANVIVKVHRTIGRILLKLSEHCYTR